MSIVRRFSAEGFAVSLVSRQGDKMEEAAATLTNARGYACDLSNSAEIPDVLAQIAADQGPVSVLVYNASSGAWGTADEVTPEELRANLEVNAVGLLTAAQAVLPGMRAAKKGTILAVGASAALRGRAATIAFAAGKAAQRSVAQSLARQLGPENIHVAYMVLDGVVDLERSRARMPDKPDTFFMDPDAIAEAAWMLYSQDRQAWTFELDLRPFGETW